MNKEQHKTKREKVFINGWECWIDRERQILYEKEGSKNGILYDTDNNYYLRGIHLTKNESKQLLEYLKKGG